MNADLKSSMIASSWIPIRDLKFNTGNNFQMLYYRLYSPALGDGVSVTLSDLMRFFLYGRNVDQTQQHGKCFVDQQNNYETLVLLKLGGKQTCFISVRCSDQYPLLDPNWLFNSFSAGLDFKRNMKVGKSLPAPSSWLARHLSSCIFLRLQQDYLKWILGL